MYKEYDENTEKRKGNKYEEIMQELAKDCGILIAKYAPALHKACYDDNSGVTLSHLRIVRAIQQDCIRVYTNTTHQNHI